MALPDQAHAGALLPRHRAYVEHRLSGKSAAESYILAYDRPPEMNRVTAAKNGHRIEFRPDVQRAMAQLREVVQNNTRNAMVTRLGITKEYVMRSLHEVAERCMQHVAVLDKYGNPVLVSIRDTESDDPEATKVAAAYTFDAKGATSALIPLGKELGMFVERREVRHGNLADKSSTELEAVLLESLAELAEITGRSLVEIAAEHGLAVSPAVASSATTPGPTTAAPPHEANVPPTAPQGGSASASGAHGTNQVRAPSSEFSLARPVYEGGSVAHGTPTEGGSFLEGTPFRSGTPRPSGTPAA